ncbi:hypothetical protein N657DRAFT_583805 [Parathielavia appendiculata]|uniref:histidine kinase n=1 Tax=Parathielavia appendiculata TaxID=2587402 RepID=A0AAN6TPN2_9PEZI|nr:hypothetical protein N657DRAFT_583805 [Parathielavia appendiculata]
MTTAAHDSDSDSVSSWEAARERETFKYDALEISTASLRNPEVAKPIPSAVLSSTPDPGLTAFAQLGLYRLGGSRALVSLFDRRNQHIVAEAVRATPLNLNEDHRDQLWLCGTAVPRATSICEHVLAGPASSLTIPGSDTGDTPSDLPVSVLLSLDQDARFNDVQDPSKRFYVGVPIRSPAGINIGVYCIFDDKPRQDVSSEEVQFIRDMSVTIMSYLETKRSHECYRREERMVRGLGSFVEGKAMLSNWSHSSNPSFRDIPGVREGSLNKHLRAGSDNGKLPPIEAGKSPTDDTFSAPTRTRSIVGKTEAPLGRNHRASPLDMLEAAIEGLFSKASNIVRESIEVAGVAYLDASIRTFGGLVGQEMPSPPVLGKPPFELESSGDDSEVPASRTPDAAEEATTYCEVLGFSTSQTSSVNGDKASPPLTQFPEKLLHHLLQRYPHGKIYNMEADPARPLPGGMHPDSSICSMRRRRDTETETISSRPIQATTNGKSNGSREKSPPKTKQAIRSVLSRMFPGARSVVFVPLYDAQKSRWFAGSLVWTCTPTRIFTPENELSYLKAFGLTIMSEVTRLHIKAADKTKMDVLGAISHELRSPLHAVVGAAELLRQTDLDGSQEGFLRTIQISSTTLLDTIDHLLDYGKMNPFLKTAGLERSNSGRLRLRQSRQDQVATVSEPLRGVVPVQLDRLAEEVVESVLVGFGSMLATETQDVMWGYHRSLASHRSVAPAEHTAGQTGAEPPIPVQILFDIEPADSWLFCIHPGAFRRIIMNLFGNSLKFTKQGFIKVELRQERLQVDKPGTQQEIGKIVLTVTDTGKGISEEYLRNQLYTPFAQEDHFAPGTGLGLSLIRQVVTALGGEIHVTSQVGVGTSVKVFLPLPFGERTADEENDSFRALTQELAGSRVLLRGCGDNCPENKSRGLDTNGHRVPDISKPQLELLQTICNGWLNMQVLSEAQAHSNSPDFVIQTREFWTGLEQAGGALGLLTCPHVFICRTPRVVQSMNAQRPSRIPAFVELTSQPLGPRKLARALLDSRRRWEEAQQAVTAVLKDAGILAPRSSTLPLVSVPPRDDARCTARQEELRWQNGDSRVLPEKLAYPPSASAPVSEAPAKTVRQSVLIVDDNPINLKILAAYVKQLGLPHGMAKNGLEALEMYKASPSQYSCLLTDVSMPIMDGIESSRRVREFERAGQLPPCKIIAITGLSGTDVEQDAFASGVDRFLTRPVTLKHILATLEELGLR